MWSNVVISHTQRWMLVKCGMQNIDAEFGLGLGQSLWIKLRLRLRFDSASVLCSFPYSILHIFRLAN